MSTLVRVSHVSKTFPSRGDALTGQGHLRALQDISFSVREGERVGLLGVSGSGKSTLIRLLCGLSVPDAGDGEILVDGSTVFSARYPERQLVRRARRSFGVIFQQFNLVGQLDVMTNVLIGVCSDLSVWQVLRKSFTVEQRACALDCLEKVGLAAHAYQRASTLSGGQQQRVAVARALLKNPRIVFADEPVASLDPSSATRVMDLLAGLSRELNITLVVSLHQVDIARTYCDRILGLQGGRLVLDSPAADLDQARFVSLYGQSQSAEPNVSGRGGSASEPRHLEIGLQQIH
jgi:phosphonate transport system ATP-binding protein